MAHFYGGVRGRSDTTTTRLGTKKSGLVTFANGWNCGVLVRGRHNQETYKDELHVWATAGSKAIGSETFIGKVVETDKHGYQFIPA
jgi:hypothetical protein